MNIRLSLLVAATLVPSASAATVPGAGSVTIDGMTYGLWGIDAPAPAQTCSGGWPAGRLAEQALARLVEDKTVTCEARDKDRLGRTVAVCKADGVDLGEALVREGMAWAKLGMSHGYVVQEAQAASRSPRRAQSPLRAARHLALEEQAVPAQRRRRLGVE